MGELAELGFMHRAATRGFGVARPYGDSHPYDILVQHGRRLLRIQVKSCFSSKGGYRRKQYQIKIVHRGNKRSIPYSSEHIDFIAVFIAPYDVWYVIPVEALEKRMCIRLYPGGIRSKRICARFEQFREAWRLMEG